MAIAILISVTILNIVLWAIMIFRFRKMFSTEKILEKARREMNHMVSDLDTATQRDIFLTSEASNRIKQQVEEADRQMNSIIKQYNEATNRLRSMIGEVNKIPAAKLPDEELNFRNIPITNGRTDYEYQKAGRNFTVLNSTIPSEKVEPKESSLKITKVMNDSDDYTSNPFMDNNSENKEFIPPPVFVASQKESKKNTMQKKVKTLYDEGYNIKQIAAEVSLSETEVQLILEML